MANWPPVINPFRYSVESNLLSMPMSRTISSIQLKSSSLTPYCTSYEI